MNRAIALILYAACAGTAALGDTGVIIPSGRSAPDGSILSTESMNVRIVIDNGHATVALREVFHNHGLATQEGVYSLALPGDAAVSDFAVWDDLTRIPGVILERKRASELYEEIRNQSIDPGLLQSAEVSESNAPGQAKRSTEFTVNIVPILPYGYKRIEAEYRQTVPVSQLTSDFVLPLKASVPLRIGSLSVSIDIRSEQPITKFEEVSKEYPLKITTQTPNALSASFTQNDVDLKNDLEIKYTLANDKTPRVTTYRTGEAAEPGYFETSAILQPSQAQVAGAASGRTVVVLFDTSLSMQWDKLERSFQAMETILRSLKPADSFNVITFNSDPASFAPKPQSATADSVAKALDFVRATDLRGGTNLQAAFKPALAEPTQETYVVLLSDGEMTEGTIAPRKFESWLDQTWRAIPAERRPHLYTMAIGDDANIRFMRRLAAHAGAFEQVNTTEPLEFKLASFVHEIGLAPLSPVNLTVSPKLDTKFVYRLKADDYPGTRAAWVGEYMKPSAAEFTVTAGAGANAWRQSTHAQLAAVNTAHPYLPATWARARVDALLEKIDREGEDKASIDEVIRLSRKYHFVTPYTSFLAAPRALLRPRLIRPGDPVLRVRTDASITSVIALFPFGLTKPLRYLSGEDIWQTRFVAPDDMADGAHLVRLILRDREGHVFREEKTFLISSHPPVIRVRMDRKQVHAGEWLALHVEASQSTRTITAQLYGAETLSLRWNESDKSNTGVLNIPATLQPGRYSIHITAEDVAHNVSHLEAPLEILP